MSVPSGEWDGARFLVRTTPHILFPPPAVASSPTSTVPPAVSQVGEHGAAGPHGTGIYGEVGPTAGPSAPRRPAAPTTNKTPLVAASGVPNNAG